MIASMAVVGDWRAIVLANEARWVDYVAWKEKKSECVADIGAGEEVKLDTEFDVLRAPSDFNWVLAEDTYDE